MFFIYADIIFTINKINTLFCIAQTFCCIAGSFASMVFCPLLSPNAQPTPNITSTAASIHALRLEKSPFISCLRFPFIPFPDKKRTISAKRRWGLGTGPQAGGLGDEIPHRSPIAKPRRKSSQEAKRNLTVALRIARFYSSHKRAITAKQERGLSGMQFPDSPLWQFTLSYRILCRTVCR